MADHLVALGSAARTCLSCLAGSAALCAALAAPPLQAHPLTLGFTSASSGWQTSLDQGNTWTSDTYAGYPNGASMPYHVRPDGTVLGGLGDQLMWFWNQATPPTGQDGPTEVRFRHKLTALNLVADYRIYLAADDFLEVYLGGYRIADYALDRDKAPDGQPGLLALDIAGSLLVSGPWLEIVARDGGAQPFDRLNEYLFVDSLHGEAFSSALKFAAPGYAQGDYIGPVNSVVRGVYITSVPEPASMELSVLALAALAGCGRQRTRHRAGSGAPSILTRPPAPGRP